MSYEYSLDEIKNILRSYRIPFNDEKHMTVEILTIEGSDDVKKFVEVFVEEIQYISPAPPSIQFKDIDLDGDFLILETRNNEEITLDISKCYAVMMSQYDLIFHFQNTDKAHFRYGDIDTIQTFAIKIQL